MNETMHLVCPHCRAINRIPHARLDHAPNCGQCHQPLFNAHPVELDAAMLDRYLSRDEIPLLIDFWAPWCGPCKMMAPHFVQAAGLLEPNMRLGKVDTQTHPGLGTRYRIRSIPTLILFKGGREIARQSGALQAADIVRWAQSHLQ